MDDITLLKRKIMDTANRAYSQNIYCYTNFLSISELSTYHSMQKELSFINSQTFGGSPASERQVIQFGSAAEFGYEDTFPIDTLCVTPLVPKFAENLNHRDYLGAILNLGIDRSLIGDIVIKEHTAYIFCINHISDFVIENLIKIKHTNVKCSICTLQIDDIAPTLTDMEIIAASPRIDAVVAALTGLSRSKVIELFTSGKIYVNSLCCQNYSAQLKAGDILVVRGLGKFIYEGNGNETRKGRVYIRLKKYV